MIKLKISFSTGITISSRSKKKIILLLEYLVTSHKRAHDIENQCQLKDR